MGFTRKLDFTFVLCVRSKLLVIFLKVCELSSLLGKQSGLRKKGG